MCTFAGREKIRKKKKETTTNDKQFTKYHHLQHHEKEDKVVFSMTRWDNIFGHGDTLETTPKRRERTPRAIYSLI